MAEELTAGAEAAVLEMDGVAKSFGATQALRDVSLSVRRGEVHALIGENGAGKSTLMKVLAGAIAPDAGTMRLGGKPYQPGGPQDARRAGIGMIYQELNLALDLTVEANIFLGMEEARWGLARRGAQEERARQALELLGHADIHPRRRTRELSVSARQVVEIARALASDARVIVLDEPTSSLTQADTARLFDVIGKLAARGVSLIYISHFLEEVQRIAGRFTVLREGLSVGGGDARSTPLAAIVEMMIGRSLGELFPSVPHSAGEPILELEGLTGVRMPRNVDLTLRRGEILGIAGLVGAGRTEMLRAIFGLDAVRDGRVRIAAMDSGAASPAVRLRQGLGFLSEDRKEEGLAVDRSIADNITLSAFERVSRLGWVLPGAQRREACRWIDRLRIKCRGGGQRVGDLSGGNQQKVAMARLLCQQADVLLLDEPTRGIDIASKVEIYRLMGELAAQGKAVLFVSSYLPELLGVADRIAVMTRGRLSPPRPASEWSEASIMACATGGAAA